MRWEAELGAVAAQDSLATRPGVRLSVHLKCVFWSVGGGEQISDSANAVAEAGGERERLGGGALASSGPAGLGRGMRSQDTGWRAGEDLEGGGSSRTKAASGSVGGFQAGFQDQLAGCHPDLTVALAIYFV